MTVIWDEDLEKIYNKLEKIDVKDIECGTVRFITYSEKGSMRSPGDFTMLTKDCKVSENNYLSGTITNEDIIGIIPEFKDVKIGFRTFYGSGLDNWNVFNMGFGNFLLVHKEISDKFIKSIQYYMPFKISKRSVVYNLQELYTTWLYGALTALKFEK